VLYYWRIQSLFIRSCFKTQFPLRTAAISSRFVVGTKFVLDVALATPAAILNLRLARENFARSRNESSFETASRVCTKVQKHRVYWRHKIYEMNIFVELAARFIKKKKLFQ
jgi:hypothetical protein